MFEDFNDSVNESTDKVRNNEKKYKDVPTGQYEVEVVKLDVVLTKSTNKPMMTTWYRIINGEYENQRLFENSVLSHPYPIGLAETRLNELVNGGQLFKYNNNMESFRNEVLDVAESIEGNIYRLDYKAPENGNGWPSFGILDVVESNDEPIPF